MKEFLLALFKYKYKSLYSFREEFYSKKELISTLERDVETLKKKLLSLTKETYKVLPDYRITFSPAVGYFADEAKDYVLERKLEMNEYQYLHYCKAARFYENARRYSSREEAQKGLEHFRTEEAKG